MSIITWIENGKKQFAVCESRFFDQFDRDFPVYESRHRSFYSIMNGSDEEVVMVSGDRKRYRILRSQSQTESANPSGNRKVAFGSKSNRQSA